MICLKDYTKPYARQSIVVPNLSLGLLSLFLVCIDVIFASDARCLALNGGHEGSEDEFEPVQLDKIKHDLKGCACNSTSGNQRWVAKDIEGLLYLVVSDKELAHEDDSDEDVHYKEERIDSHEGEAGCLLVLKHAPPHVHWESCPLAEEISG